MAEVPRAPKGLGDAGKRLWKAVLGSYDLEEHELTLLLEGCRIADTLDRLEGVVADEGLMVTVKGEPKPHPAVVEARLQRQTLARLLASLRLPDDSGVRPQRRGSARGAYLRGLAGGA